MNVYFGQNFWGTGENGGIGFPQKVNWQFTFENQEFQIPFIYHFSEGITMDIVSLLDTEKINNFIEKYENRVNHMNEEELLCLEADRPIPEFSIHKIYINNKLAEVSGSCAATYIAGRDYEDNNDILRNIQKAYDIPKGKDISFHCIRVHVKFLEASQREIRSLKFIPFKTEEFLPIKQHFELEVGMSDTKTEVIFSHPLTDMKHHVYVNEVKACNAREIPLYDLNLPFNFAGMVYELEPPLPQNERLVIREIEQPDEATGCEGSTMIEGTSQAMGIFGISEVVGFGIHGYPLEVVYTKLYWKALRNIKMSIVGICKEKSKDIEILVYDA